MSAAASQTAGKVLDVLAALLGYFAHGMTPTDLCKATGLDPSAITRSRNRTHPTLRASRTAR